LKNFNFTFQGFAQQTKQIRGNIACKVLLSYDGLMGEADEMVTVKGACE